MNTFLADIKTGNEMNKATSHENHKNNESSVGYNTLTDRARGCLLGLAIGDALGVKTEGKTPAEIKRQFGFVKDFLTDEPAGSDDTEFALFNALILLDYGRQTDSAIIAEQWRKYIVVRQGAFKGAGFSEIMAITNLRKGLQPPYSGMHSHSWSDGLAMRVAPFGIIYPGEPQKAAHLAGEDGSVTHTAEGIYCGQAVAAAIASAMGGAGLHEIFQSALGVIPENSWTSRAVNKAVESGYKFYTDNNISSDDIPANYDEVLAELHRNLACSYYHWADLGPEAVGLCFGILAAAGGEFVPSVLGGVNVGRDTDTIAAIAGAITGAAAGCSRLPEKWTRVIKASKGLCIERVRDLDIKEIADKLITLVKPL